MQIILTSTQYALCAFVRSRLFYYYCYRYYYCSLGFFVVAPLISFVVDDFNEIHLMITVVGSDKTEMCKTTQQTNERAKKSKTLTTFTFARETHSWLATSRSSSILNFDFFFDTMLIANILSLFFFVRFWFHSHFEVIFGYAHSPACSLERAHTAKCVAFMVNTDFCRTFA